MRVSSLYINQILGVLDFRPYNLTCIIIIILDIYTDVPWLSLCGLPGKVNWFELSPEVAFCVMLEAATLTFLFIYVVCRLFV